LVAFDTDFEIGKEESISDNLVILDIQGIAGGHFGGEFMRVKAAVAGGLVFFD
jgi:hypothetical protein